MRPIPSIVLTAALTAFAACSSDPSSPSSDPRSEARALANKPVACSSPADCCRVVDGCRAQLLVVSAADRAHVEDLIAQSDQSMCVGCITPLVQVDCVAGECTASELDLTLMGKVTVPQCGRIDVPAGNQQGLRSGDSGLSSSKSPLILGCGP